MFKVGLCLPFFIILSFKPILDFVIMNENDIQVNSWQAWLLAARPKTLTGAAVPVIIALALAYADLGKLHPVPAILCLFFALLMQIDANFINDYYDFRKGTDDEQRLGPLRVCARGWVTLPAMKRAILITTFVACAIGIPLIGYGGWSMVIVGLLCVLFCFLYTTHLSYLGLGDVLVLVFFGLVPVCATYYLQTTVLSMECVLASFACGLVIDTLLIVNNYRDRDNDLRTGKMTLVTRIGANATEKLYLVLGVAAILIGVVFAVNGRWWAFLLPFVYLALHTVCYKRMKEMNHGKQLNVILGENARNMLIYGILVSVGLIL